jgi:hypothetical protein
MGFVNNVSIMVESIYYNKRSQTTALYVKNSQIYFLAKTHIVQHAIFKQSQAHLNLKCLLKEAIVKINLFIDL